MVCLLCIVVIITVIIICYWLLMRPYNHWKSRGVSQGKPVPIFGDMWRMIFRTRSIPEINQDLYNIDTEARYVGFYQFNVPAIIIRDPELIKQITIKDFDHFLDHRGFTVAEADPLLGNSLLSLRGLKWRQMRSTLSPSFTSSKMKYMFHLMSQTGEKFVKGLLSQDSKITTAEMRDLLSKYTSDVIANTVFGFECDSLKDPNNMFFKMGKDASDFTSLKKLFVFIGYVVIPKIMTFFKFTLFSDKMNDYFTQIIKENMSSREKQGIVRPDMISLLMEAKKNRLTYEESTTLPDTGFATAEESEIGKDQKLRKIEITDEDIVSQAFIFFFAGFDSVSNVMAFMSYELAINQDVQERLRKEVDEARGKCQGTLTYETVTTMKYLDMVVTETLRKWPVAIATDRICTKPYTIEPTLPNEKPLYLKENEIIIIPMFAIQRDPKYWPEPERFDPERFNDENRDKIISGSYIPFGSGVRNCIGSRFALLEIKIIFFHLLSNFEIVPVAETPIPLKFSKKTANMGVEKGYWLGLKKRKD